MSEDVFKERGRSFEEEYFRKHEAKLIAKLRERGRLEEISEALAMKLQIDSPDLLSRIMALGVTVETGPAFLLAPLVQVAWAGSGGRSCAWPKSAASNRRRQRTPSSMRGSPSARRMRFSTRPSRRSKAGCRF